MSRIRRARVAELIQRQQAALAAVVRAVAVVDRPQVGSQGLSTASGPTGLQVSWPHGRSIDVLRRASATSGRRRPHLSGRLALPAIALVFFFAVLVIPGSSVVPTVPKSCLPSNVCNTAAMPAALTVWPTDDLGYTERLVVEGTTVPNHLLAMLPNRTGLYVLCYTDGALVRGPRGTTRRWVFVNWTTRTAWTHAGYVSGAYANVEGIGPASTWPPCPSGIHGW